MFVDHKNEGHNSSIYIIAIINTIQLPTYHNRFLPDVKNIFETIIIIFFLIYLNKNWLIIS